MGRSVRYGWWFVAGLYIITVGCSPAPVPSAAQNVRPLPTPTLKVITPTSPDADVRGDGCGQSQEPRFAYGFAALKEALGDRMGEALSCERYGPDGDSLQQTTLGVARYVKSTNTPTFISGTDHWALTEDGLVHWTGTRLEPPEAAAVAVAPPMEAAVAAPEPEAVAESEPDPLWLDKAVGLIREYDRKHGTMLGTALDQTRLVVFRIPGAWAAFVPSARTITLDPVLANESPEAVATVLAHEAEHAVDQILNGGAQTEVACYSYEISAFRLQAAVWQSFFGPAGKLDARTRLERELNEILRSAQSDAGRLITAIHSSYADQCA